MTLIMNHQANTPAVDPPDVWWNSLRAVALRFSKTPPVSIGFAVLVVILDHASGPSINLSLFFLVPVVLEAWHRGLPFAAAFVVVLPLCRLWFESNWGEPWSQGDAIGNCLVRMLALAGFALVTSRLARAERRLRDSERLYQSLVENIPQGIFRKDAAGRFTFANRKFCEHLGKPTSEVIGKVDADLFPPDLSAKYQKDDRCVIETGRNLETVEERRPLREKPVYTHVIKTPLRDDQTRVVGIQGIYWDVTQQRLLQDQLRQAQKMEAIGQLAGGVAHNFNNILTSMLISVELVLVQDHLDTVARSTLLAVKAGIERAARLTHQLLLYSRPYITELQVLDLNQTVLRQLELFREIMGGGIILQFDPKNEPLEIEADESMIAQVVLTLVNNAGDAMSQGGVLQIATAHRKLSADVTVGNPEARPGQYAILEVTDTGCGMDRATAERIFEPFFTTKDVGRGTGLGLSTVHGIVKQHMGWVEVKSQPGMGSVFRVYLPALSKEKTNATTSETATDSMRDSETILQVDDKEVPRRRANESNLG